MIDGAFASRMLIVQFSDGTKEEVNFTFGPILNNETMFNYLCTVSCSNRLFKDKYIAGVDQVDAVDNAIRFMENMIKENIMGIKFFWPDDSLYDNSRD